MVKKLQKISAQKSSAGSLADAVKESAQQIWLAGLGAFSKSQDERGKAFETLVKEGVGLQRKTQAAAEEKITEATSKMAGMASGLSAKATGITSLATGQWDKLETIFEERVAKALNRLGVPSAKDVAALVARIDELTQAVQKLGGVPEAAAPSAPAARKAAPRKAAAKAKPVAEAAPAPETPAPKVPAVRRRKPAAAAAPTEPGSAD